MRRWGRVGVKLKLPLYIEKDGKKIVLVPPPSRALKHGMDPLLFYELWIAWLRENEPFNRSLIAFMQGRYMEILKQRCEKGELSEKECIEKWPRGRPGSIRSYP
jgi:hypothetical protein